MRRFETVTARQINTLICAIGSGLVGLVVFRLSRQQRLSFRYTVGWLSLCAIGVLAGFFIPIVQPISEALRLTPAAFLALGALTLLVAICIQLSISISGLQQQVRRLSEELALQELIHDRRQGSNEQ